MSELVYSKRNLDYGFFRVTEGYEQQVPDRMVRDQERFLANTGAMKLPADETVDGTFAYYYDTQNGILKQATWNYSTKHDIRGYVEVRMMPLQEQAISTLMFQEATLEVMAELLAAMIKKRRTTSLLFVKVNLDSLFTQPVPKDMLFMFLKWVYLFLPRETAERVVFINRYGNLDFQFAETFSGAFSGQKQLSFQAADPWVMELLHGCGESLEYRMTLRYLWVILFQKNVKIPMQLFDDVATMPLSERLTQLSAFHSRIQRLEETSGIVCSDPTHKKNMLDMTDHALEKQLHILCDEPDFQTKLGIYHEMMAKLLDTCGDSLTSELEALLSFRNIHRNCTQETADAEAFQILQTLGTHMLPSDAAYYNSVCVSAVMDVRSGTEMATRIRQMSGCTIARFCQIVKLPSQQDRDFQRFCKNLAERSYDMLKQYHGYCKDDEFQAVCEELKHTMTFSDAVEYDFRKPLLTIYRYQHFNKLQTQSFASFFLDEHTTLEELLSLVGDWRLEDFFVPVNLAIVDCLIHTLRTEVPDAEFELENDAILNFLMQYRQFRAMLDKILETADYDRAEQLFHKAGALANALCKMYNACCTKEGKEIRLFVCKNIVGNPAQVLYLMVGYYDYFLQKTNRISYNHFYQFYVMLFHPLLEAGQLSIKDIQYLIWCFQKNAMPFGQELRYKKRQLIHLSGRNKEKDEKNAGWSDSSDSFLSEIMNRLCRRYQLPAEDEGMLEEEIESYNQKYFAFIMETDLAAYSDYYTDYLKKYMTNLIRDL